MKKNQENSKRCPFFDICAAHIIRDRMKDQESFKILISKGIVINLKKWSEQVCFGDFEKCPHFAERKEAEALAC